ncbi:MAG: 50S ribosomal protein L11 methyltransferase [Dehalococcoidales bacterium]|nr:50S ribosomal protein L11 methyltransferase [Dehalococcoidales bacterium]
MRWIELTAAVDSDRVRIVSGFLDKYGQGGSVIESRNPGEDDKKVSPGEEDEKTSQEWKGRKTFLVKIYLPSSRSYQTIRSEIFRGLAELGVPEQPAERWLKPEDWLDSLKQHFGILEIGERFIIKPSWAYKPLPPSTRIVIQLDPGAAFGTGLHATTRLCLLRLEKHFLPGISLLDVGTGSGILAIAAARLGASDVLALDTDTVAVRAARNNAAANSVGDIVRVRHGTLSLRTIRESRCRFDMAMANITAAVICDLAGGIYKSLKNGGRLVVSGINSQSLDEILIRLALEGFTLEAADQYDSWYAVIARKD